MKGVRHDQVADDGGAAGGGGFLLAEGGDGGGDAVAAAGDGLAGLDGSGVAGAGDTPTGQADGGAAGAADLGEGGDSSDAAGGDAAIVYQDFKLPAGYAADPVLMDEFKATLAGMKLTQDQAQLVADLGVKQASALLAKFGESGQAQQAALAEAFKVGEGSVKAADFQQPAFIKQQAAEWEAAIKADKELGGEKLPENLSVAWKALNALGSDALLQLLDKSGLGSHPDLIRAFYRAGKLISEDALVAGGKRPGGAAVGRTAHEINANKLYG
ncbi:MAG: hypothetical protein PHW13_11895 [Methylococcales bacterium]|nr:hypothetical protein [Methylococcales bacterium]